jgi:ADP-ribose pyrophosphatase YjhB (NUDIX family)
MKMPAKQKTIIARLVKIPIIHRCMIIAVRLIVPRHRIGVAVVPMNSKGEVLMLRHVFHPSAPWGIPGGWLGRNESPEEGVLRELYEETGLTGTIENIIFTLHDPHPPHVAMSFLGRVEPAEMTLSGEIIEAKWVNRDNLPTPLLPFVRGSIEAAFAQYDAKLASPPVETGGYVAQTH